MSTKQTKNFYTDGGVSGNGNFGHQKAYISGCEDDGRLLFLKEVGDKTNNEAELLAILELLQTVKNKKLIIYSDSQLAVHLIDKTWHTNIDRLRIILREIWLIEKYFIVKWIPREDNKAGWVIEQQYGL